ncbi:MAG: VOC family protein [Deltaproteobacteria bacterium]|nr:VOC family protein [Deltaproteobacteria bacterium]
MEIELDHIAMPVGDVERSVQFYREVLGAEPIGLEDWRAGGARPVGLSFGRQKFNLHPPGSVILPRAAKPTVGSADVCFVWPGPIQSAVAHLASHGVALEQGPLPRLGARGKGVSVYCRDPDGNLLEFISYGKDPTSPS